MLKTRAIQKFLYACPFPTARLYTPNMEVQVNVAQDDGEVISGLYLGKRWHGYTDGLQTWKHFRIPWTSGKFEDSELKFDISKHAEAIGMTGWDFVNQKSLWVGFDFDALVGHKEGLTKGELDGIRTSLGSVPFINIFSSTSGLGLHIYVFIDDSSQRIENHTEHAAVARSILDKISALSGLKLNAKVDCMGGNMWVWHRRAGPESYVCTQEGFKLTEIPKRWREYLDRVSKTKLTERQQTDKSILIAAYKRIDLEEDHIKLIKWFESSQNLWWWDADKSMLICHTFALKRAFIELNYQGYFNTISEGKDSDDQNCFAFPIKGGAWVIRRHTRGVSEHESWFKDSSGWTSCYLNRLPDLRTASRNAGAVETDKEFCFSKLSHAFSALLAMGIDEEMPKHCKNRPATIKQLKDNRIILVFDRAEIDDDIPGYAKKKKEWQRIFFRPHVQDEVEIPDNLLRHVVIESTREGWYLNTHTGWINEDKSEIIHVLSSLGYKKSEVDPLLGSAILHNWRLVNKPFQSEYPGNREWNRFAPQFRFDPKEGPHPTWDLLLEHLGRNLNEHVCNNSWLSQQGITTGSRYFQAWIALLFSEPEQPLPYLFLYGPQNCGKSIIHEALSLLITRGAIRADHALINPNGFNGELSSSILCIVEETNLSIKGIAVNRIKDWVTGLTISIHQKNKTPYDIKNFTHWVQCANAPDHCPIFPGDTRITVVKVEPLTTVIPKPLLLQRLEHEAPAFLYTCINFELDTSPERLRLPVVDTPEKLEQQELNKTPLEIFCDGYVRPGSNTQILFSEFYTSFISWLDPKYHSEWSRRKVTVNLPYVKKKISGSIWIMEIILKNH